MTKGEFLEKLRAALAEDLGSAAVQEQVAFYRQYIEDEVRKGRNGEYTKELWIDRREKSKSLAWSSVRLAFHNIKQTGEIVERPKALGDIRGVTYIYGMFYRFGLIDVPDKVKEKMKEV